MITAPLPRGAFREEARPGIRMPQILLKECGSGGGRLRRRSGANTCTLARMRAQAHVPVPTGTCRHVRTYSCARAHRRTRSLQVQQKPPSSLKPSGVHIKIPLSHRDLNLSLVFPIKVSNSGPNGIVFGHFMF